MGNTQDSRRRGLDRRHRAGTALALGRRRCPILCPVARRDRARLPRRVVRGQRPLLPRRVAQSWIGVRRCLRSRMPIPHQRFCMERYGGGSIVVSDYDPAWSAMFEHARTSLHSRSLRADHRAHWEHGGARPRCQADHRPPGKRASLARSTIPLRRTASGVSRLRPECLHLVSRFVRPEQE